MKRIFIVLAALSTLVLSGGAHYSIR